MTEKAIQLQEKVKEKVQILKKQGGFKILEGIIDGKKGIRDLNPKKEARRAAFLTDADKAEKRGKLKAELTALKSLLETGSVVEATAKAKETTETVRATFNENLQKAFEATKDLEKSYRSAALFFRNANADTLQNVYFLNIPVEEFVDDNNANLREGLDRYFKENYDRFSLQDNYSLFVIPGYLENSLEFWSKMASKYRITLVTDYSDEQEMQDIRDKIDEQQINGDDRILANTLVTCNYGVVRKKYDGIESDDLYIPASLPLAGKMYDSNGIQPAAGKKHGKLDGLLGSRIGFLRSEASEIDKMGMIPIISEKADWGTVAMSDTTLANESTDPDLKAIGVVRAKDWIAKVLLDYFNSLTFNQYDGRARQEILGQLNKFFTKIKGHGRLIEKYTIVGPTQDPTNPQAVRIAVNIKPYFAVKHYVIDFTGTNSDFTAEEQE